MVTDHVQGGGSSHGLTHASWLNSTSWFIFPIGFSIHCKSGWGIEARFNSCCIGLSHIIIGGSRGVLLACTPPTGSSSSIFAYVFAEKCPRWRSAPPSMGNPGSATDHGLFSHRLPIVNSAHEYTYFSHFLSSDHLQNYRTNYLHALDPVPWGFEVKIKFLKFIYNHLELDLQPIFNVSCDFGGDLMARMGKISVFVCRIYNGSLWENKP